MSLPESMQQRLTKLDSPVKTNLIHSLPQRNCTKRKTILPKYKLFLAAREPKIIHPMRIAIYHHIPWLICISDERARLIGRLKSNLTRAQWRNHENDHRRPQIQCKLTILLIISDSSLVFPGVFYLNVFTFFLEILPPERKIFLFFILCH